MVWYAMLEKLIFGFHKIGNIVQRVILEKNLINIFLCEIMVWYAVLQKLIIGFDKIGNIVQRVILEKNLINILFVFLG